MISDQFLITNREFVTTGTKLLPLPPVQRYNKSAEKVICRALKKTLLPRNIDLCIVSLSVYFSFFDPA